MSKVRQPNHHVAARVPDFYLGHEGVAFVATLRGTPGRDVLDTALDALRNLHHGRSQASGILTHIPHRLLREELGPDLPAAGRYALGFAYLNDIEAERRLITAIAAKEGFAVLTWREVPLNDTIVTMDARASMPAMAQVILTPAPKASQVQIDAGLYRIRKQVEARSEAYFASLSRTTVVYKALVAAPLLAVLYSDLANPDYRTEIAIVHSCRGNDYHSWRHAQPHRILAHDGQIHSAPSNETWLHARGPLMESDLLAGVDHEIPRSHLAEGSLDELVELLHRSGRQLTHALRMVIPEQWGRRMSRTQRDFYDYSATVVEPWEGSGVTCFADGYLVGAVLDRHGTRSGRYWVTEAGLVVFASETGVVDLDPSTITKKGRLAPGELIAVDTVVGNLLPSDAVRAQIASKHPYGEWLAHNLLTLPAQTGAADAGEGSIDPAYHVNAAGVRSVHDLARGRDAPGPGTKGQLTFFDRFRSRRSQLTSPYIDAVAMPSPPGVYIGPQGNLLRDGPEHARKVLLPGPAISTRQAGWLAQRLRTAHVCGVYPAPITTGGPGLREELERVRTEVEGQIAAGAEVIVVSDRGARSGSSVPVPSLLLVAAAHQHLLVTGNRARVSLLAEAGDAVEPIHIVRLLEAGAEAVVPYHGEVLAGAGGAAAYLEGLNARVYRLLLESGVADYRAYQGSRRFHIVGLEAALVEEVFTGAAKALGAFGLDDLDRQLAQEPAVLDPIHLLLRPVPGRPVPVETVEDESSLRARMVTSDALVIGDTRAGVDLIGLSTSADVLLAPPAHHDTLGADGLRLLIHEVRSINPDVRVHVRVGADLTSDFTAMEAIGAGADVIDLVDGEYEWVFGLLSLRQSTPLEHARIAVGSPLRTAKEIFIAAVLGAHEFRLHADADPHRLAADLRSLLARAGVRRLADLTGRSDLLDWSEAIEQWRRAGVNLEAIGRRKVQFPLPEIDGELDSLDDTLIDLTAKAISDGAPTRINAFVSNTDVSVGARIAGEVARAHGAGGLPEGTIRLTLTGSSGAALGAYAAPGMTIVVQGEAGDFVGKGLSGGRIVVRPESTASFSPQENVIAGSAIGYGARSGGIYLAGEVGERLGAHNWGATIVSEGAGDAAGYRMHAGTLVILGATGVNLGAGLEGGVIYVLDLDPDSLYHGAVPEELEVESLNETDLRVLTAVLAEHAEGTRSRIATMLLADPDQLRARFSKIHRVGYNPESNCSHGSARNVWDRILGATGEHLREKA